MVDMALPICNIDDCLMKLEIIPLFNNNTNKESLKYPLADKGMGS